MYQILSAGTAFNFAVTTGDAGQLGMVAEFDGFFSGPIISHWTGLTQGVDRGDRYGSDICGGDRLWADLSLGLRSFLALAGCLLWGDSPLGRPCQRRGWPYVHSFSQHFVSQH